MPPSKHNLCACSHNLLRTVVARVSWTGRFGPGILHAGESHGVKGSSQGVDRAPPEGVSVEYIRVLAVARFWLVENSRAGRCGCYLCARGCKGTFLETGIDGNARVDSGPIVRTVLTLILPRRRAPIFPAAVTD